MEAFGRTLAQALSDHHAAIAAALTGPESMAERSAIAHRVIARLLLVYDLQVAGWLGQGDRWYLHNQLSQFAAQQPNTYFQQFLQPLCRHGLGVPPPERPQAWQQRLGDVPYLGCSLLEVHPLEQKYPQLALPDEPLEQLLGWLAEYPWLRSAQPLENSGEAISRQTLAAAYEYLVTQHTGKATLSTSETLANIRRQTIDAHLLGAIHRQPTSAISSIPELLTGLTDRLCEQLVTAVLPATTVLDPACGSGRLLLLVLERLQVVYQACWQFAQTSSSPGLQAWLRSLQATPTPPLWTLTQRLLTHTLYGVDRWPEAVTITQLQLWLRLLSTAQSKSDLARLPDLDFNITSGNALVGFIRVDEESFDTILPKRWRQSSSQETVLQGNLLQPLAAANYRDTLAEKQIRVEHYQVQTKAMGSEGGIPEYAQTEFLRDRIEAVNQAAQQKLDGLLWETFSRKLGIQVKEPQLSGRTRKRLLTRADVKALQPFHWGFVFDTAIEQQGGFDVILTHAPEGALRPSADEFYQQHADLFRTHDIELSVFRRSRRQLLQQFPQLASLWSLYAGHMAVLRDYVRRSDDYQLPITVAARHSISLKTLFIQRCAALAKADSLPPYVH
jgi:hypothetical protein